MWAIGGLIGTVAMILVGGLEGTAGSLQNLGPNTLLRALMAAVIGGLTLVPKRPSPRRS